MKVADYSHPKQEWGFESEGTEKLIIVAVYSKVRFSPGHSRGVAHPSTSVWDVADPIVQSAGRLPYRSGQNVLDNFPMNVRQAEVTALVLVGQLSVINTK